MENYSRAEPDCNSRPCEHTRELSFCVKTKVHWERFRIWFFETLYFYLFADIDECQLPVKLTDCGETSTTACVNIPGSYRCVCKQGYTGNGKRCEGKL